MNVDLTRRWNGEPLREGGGAARLVREHGWLVLRWDLSRPAPPRVPGSAPGYTDLLWEHDVVELFVAGASGARYLELEAGPEGHWIALAFEDVRRRAAELRDLELVLAHDADERRWRGSLAVREADVARHAGPEPWRVLVAACFGAPDARVYLASAPLPGERPDFHQPGAWPTL